MFVNSWKQIIEFELNVISKKITFANKNKYWQTGGCDLLGKINV